MELLDDFYAVISRCWRDLGTPTHSKAFFRSLVNGFGSRASFVVIRLNRRPVSCALLFMCGTTLHHPFAATIKEFNKLSINNVLYWKIIEFGCQKGLRYFDMGRSKKNQGTYLYKESWGAQAIPLYYHYLLGPSGSVPNYDSRLTKLATEIWKKLPVFLTNKLGPVFIRALI